MNYTREVWKYFSAMKNLAPSQQEVHETLLSCLAKAKKFELPEGGMVMDDPKLRGLDITEPLHFPFDQITLEYSEREEVELRTTTGLHNFMTTKKVISIGCQPALVSHEASGVAVDVMVFAYVPKKHLWFPVATFLITLDDWNAGRDEDGMVILKLLRIDLFSMGVPENTEVRAHGGPPMVLAQFLNMLGCSNVQCHPKKGFSKPGKAPLPFNDYWVLTIDHPKPTKYKGEFGGHTIVDRRSPREHVRRGHIRRYEGGKKVWVNAAVINAGSAGKITKDYRVAKN